MKKLRAVLLGIFDKKQHNRQYLRVCYAYLPGKVVANCTCDEADLAAKNRHLNVVKFLHEQGISCTSVGFAWAARNGYLNIIQYLIENNICYSQEGVHYAIFYHHLHIIKYLHSKSLLHVNERKILNWVAQRGDLEMLKYIIYGQNALLINYNDIYDIIRQGHLHIIKFLRQYFQMYYSRLTLNFAEQNGQFEIAEYLRPFVLEQIDFT